MIRLRDYQRDLQFRVGEQWNASARTVLMRLGTGGGKTQIFSDLIQRHVGASCLIVHRNELVWQISLTLARLGIRHDIIASTETKRLIARIHVETLGTCFYQPGARCVVASVDTLVRAKNISTWAAQVTLWICDEGHHALRDNKWGRAIALFTNPACRGLLPTATPVRADGKGLGSHADGFADVMVEGPSERWLIEQGYLSDYDVYCPPSDMQVVGDVPASGDYSPAQLRTAAKRSHITGDLPASYLQHGQNGLGISFCTDVETAVETCLAYRALGVPTEVVTGTTAPIVRRDIFRRLEIGAIRQICVVDIVSEGTDIPAVQVGSFGRPSESMGLVRQQMGRLLRPMYAPGVPLDTQAGRLEAIASGPKPRAILIDHVQHFVKPHIGPPDRVQSWSLDRRDKRGKAASAPASLRICLGEGCFRPYERYRRACPFCGHEPEPAGRSTPEQVEGDLGRMDPAVLERLRGAVVDVSDGGVGEYARGLAETGLPPVYVAHNARGYNRKVEAQVALRAAMARWGGAQHAAGLTDVEIQRLFWQMWGVDVLTAQALAPTEAMALTGRIDTCAAAIDDGVNGA